MRPDGVGTTGAPSCAGLRRSRPLAHIDDAVDTHPVTVLVAPAGSGKTTALAQWTETTTKPVRWHTPSATRAGRDDMLTQLAALLGDRVPDESGAWSTVDGAIDRLQRAPVRDPLVLVLDDLHLIRSTPAEAVLARLIERVPDWLHLVLSTRHTPDIDLTRPRVRDLLVELRSDVLAWRPWEAERLFSEHYGYRMRPEEVARLTRRLDGWVAGFQLFHLATRELPTADRSELIGRLGSRVGLVHEYLTRNVVAGLSPALRGFMVDTCVLGTLTPTVCDAVRGRDDSTRFLRELERESLFLLPRPDGVGHRYHEVLRSHLETMLLEQHPRPEALDRYLRAGKVLEAAELVGDALHAYSRAEAWDEVDRLLTDEGPDVAADCRHALDRLPPALVRTDPWLRLAVGQRLAGEGRFDDALDSLRATRDDHPDHPVATQCQVTMGRIRPWTELPDRPVLSDDDRLRAASHRDPLRHAAGLEASATPRSDLLAGLARLLGGDVHGARAPLRRAGRSLGQLGGALARLGGVLADVLAGDRVDHSEVLWTAAGLEQCDQPFLARLGRAVSIAAHADGAQPLLDVRAVDGNAWNQVLLPLIVGVTRLRRGEEAHDVLRQAATSAASIGAGCLEAWSLAFAAFDHRGAEPVGAATAARDLAHERGIPGAEAVAEFAVAAATDDPDARLRGEALATRLGLGLAARLQPVGAARRATLAVRCIGGLRVEINGDEVELAVLRPQARTVLAALAVHAGTPVHRDRLTDLVWPDVPRSRGRQRLGVAISTVRRVLEPEAEARNWSMLLRTGESFVLRLPAGATSDLLAVDDAVLRARRAAVTGEPDREERALREVVRLGDGEVLPEFGDATWLDGPRAHRAVTVADSALRLAQLCADRRDHRAAIEAARAGIAADRFRSHLWLHLAASHRAVGDVAAAARIERDYEAMLGELGI